MCRRRNRGNSLVQCIISMAILMIFIFSVSTMNMVTLKSIERSKDLQMGKSYIENFKKEISCQTTKVNRAGKGDIFYISKEDLMTIYEKDIGSIMTPVSTNRDLMEIRILDEEEYINKVQVSYLGERIKLKEEIYVWKEKKRSNVSGSY